MMFVDSVEIMLKNVLKEQFCLVLNQYVYVGNVSGDTSPIIWQRVMVGEQIICTNVGPAWKHCCVSTRCLVQIFQLICYSQRVNAVSQYNDSGSSKWPNDRMVAVGKHCWLLVQGKRGCRER